MLQRQANGCQAVCNISQNMKLQQQSPCYLPAWKQGKLPSVTWGVNYVPFPPPCPHWPQLLWMAMCVNVKNLQFRFKIHSTCLAGGYAFDKLLQEVFGFLFILLSFPFCPHFSSLTRARAAQSGRLIISTTQQHICCIPLS